MPERDFLKRLEAYHALSKKPALEKQYNASIAPFLLEVASDLSQKYAAKELYPHVSNFRTHILFRLGPHQKITHRASVAVSFHNDYIDRGFCLTHALADGQRLRDSIRERTEEIAFGILKLYKYWIWIPNAGVTKATPIDSISLVKLKKILLKYDPQVMRECYFWIQKEYEGETMSRKQLFQVFEEEHKTFKFLLKAAVS